MWPRSVGSNSHAGAGGLSNPYHLPISYNRNATCLGKQTHRVSRQTLRDQGYISRSVGSNSHWVRVALHLISESLTTVTPPGKRNPILLLF